MNEQSILKQFAKNIETEFDVKTTTLYKNDNLLIGTAVNKVTFEYYKSIPQTTVFKSETSCLVSMIKVKSETYMIILTSVHRTAFDGLETKYMISEFKKLQKRLGGIL